MLVDKMARVDSTYTTADFKKEVDPKKQAEKSAEKNVEKAKSETPAATVELGGKETEEVTYKKPGKVDRRAIDQMIRESDRRMENFKNLIRSLIEKQGGTVQGALSGQFIVKIDEATRLEAQEAISEDGEFGVKKTAERIVSFAKAISGGDVSKLDTLKKAITKGFDEAEKILGELPEISKETYTEIMRQLDAWASGDKAGDTEVAE